MAGESSPTSALISQSAASRMRRRCSPSTWGSPSAALAMFEIYSRNGDARLITDVFLWKKLTATDDTAFPLYRPHEWKLGLIILDTNDIPDQESNDETDESRCNYKELRSK